MTDTKPSDDEFAARIKATCNEGDKEMGHYLADELLCDALVRLGYEKTVAEYRKVGKWYA